MDEQVLVILRHKLGRKRLLKRAIKSVSDQTHTEKKLLILCMDFTKEECTDTNYLLPLTQENEFFYTQSALQERIENSGANFVCFLDDDDSWAPEYLSRLVGIMKDTNSSFSSVKGISCHVNKVNEVCEDNRIIINNTQPWNHYLAAGPLDFDALHYKNSIPLSSCLFMKEGIINSLKSHNLTSPAFAWPFIIDFLSKNDLWILPEALSFYHFREDQDYLFGNYTIIDHERSLIEYKIKINEMIRASNNNDLLNFLLYALMNKTNFHRIANIEQKINGL